MNKLKRTISWPVFALYGLGNILGAGIYVLVGEVAKEAGDGLLFSFLLAGLVASFTLISYSSLAKAYPVSAGAAIYANKAFKIPSLSTLIGLGLAFSGVVSSAALLRGFNRYFQELTLQLDLGWEVPGYAVILSLVVLLGLVALRGIKESASLAVILTILEAFGLLLIIYVASTNGSVTDALDKSFSALGEVEPLAIMLGTFLAFYAFIGFEDMVNVAEEVKQPKKSIRKGMITALVVASILYLATAVASLAVLSGDQLAESNAPLASVFEAATGSTLPIITLIGLFAVTNGVLAQIIMSSRVLYGLSRESWLPNFFSKISKTRSTPTNATYFSLIAIAVGALSLPLDTLAQITSLGLLIIFTIVQLSALKLISMNKLKLHFSIPILGIVTNVLVIGIQVGSWLGAF